MKILITNDDGIKATGILVLTEAAQQFFPEARIIVFAPDKSISGAGRSLTFGSGKLVEVSETRQNCFNVHGPPCDCVDIACRITDEKFDLCLSGVNHGYNLGNDLYVSGTAQAAHYAWDYFEIPSIAFSAGHGYFNGNHQNLIKEVLGILGLCQPDGCGFFNVNIPFSCTPLGDKIVHTDLGTYRATGKLAPRWTDESMARDLKLFRGAYDLLDAMSEMKTSKDDPETDVGAVEAGFISITKIA